MGKRYELKKSTSQTEKAVMKHVEKTKKKLEELKPSLEEKFKVKSIGIFGSYIRGEERKESDLDILVEFEESADLSLLGFIRLENRLSEELGVKVDLVEKRGILILVVFAFRYAERAESRKATCQAEDCAKPVFWNYQKTSCENHVIVV